LLNMFEEIYSEGFAKEQYRVLYHVADSVESCMEYFKNYQPPQLPDKWFL